MTRPARVGRPRILDERRVAEAVLAQDPTELRIPEVAAGLNVNPATLYRFVGDHGGMVDLAVSHLIRSTEWPRYSGDWRDHLERVAWTLWRLASAHPGLISAFGRRAGGETAALYNRVTMDLVSAGFAPGDAAVSVSLVLDLAVDVTGGAPPDPLAWDGFDEVLRPVVRAAVDGDPAEWFGRKLRIALDGVAGSARNGEATAAERDSRCGTGESDSPGRLAG